MSQAKYGSVEFPFKQDLVNESLKRTVEVNSTIRAAMTAFLLTEPGQRRGNMVGSMLASLLQKTIPSNALFGIADELKKELSDNFPGVSILNVLLTQDFEDNQINLRVSIRFQTPISEIEELNLML